jgi:hypothetical protein
MQTTIDLLGQAVVLHASQGWQLASRDFYSAQMVKPRILNWNVVLLFGILFPVIGIMAAVLGLLLVGYALIGFSVWMISLALLSYLSSKPAGMFLYLDQAGQVQSISS